MKLPKGYGLPAPFWGNFYCHIPNTNFAFLSISKNACSFLKKVTIYNEQDIWLFNTIHDVIHDRIGYDPKKSPYLFEYDEIEAIKEKMPNLKIIAVWRDPVERLISTYKLFILEKEYRHYFNCFGFYNRPVSFEDFLSFVEMELSKPDPNFQDEHIRKQVDYIDDINIFDYVIHIKDLFRFLDSEKIKYIREKTNSTSIEFEYPDDHIIRKIKELYTEDYQIPISYLS